MRFLLSLMICGLAISAYGQNIQPQQKLRIQISYEKAGKYLEQAIETIDAVNTIGKSTSVEYRAGRSITMSPGFQAQSGSTFTAEIKPIEAVSETLLQLTAFPNPFEHSTTIKYYLPADGVVNLWVMDSQGKVVGQLVKAENQSAGQHSLEWAPATLSNGVYIPVIESNKKRAVSRLVKK